MNEEGEFVGMAVGTSRQKKLYPLFLPTLAQEISLKSKFAVDGPR